MKAQEKPYLPALPGIYIFKNDKNSIIYVGKAKNLSKRVGSYFQAHDKDWKVAALLNEYKNIEYIVTKNEAEALLLEAQLIRDNKPKYNVLLKNGNPFLYIFVAEDPIPHLKLVRVKPKKGRFFGPFLQKKEVRSTYNYLVRAFRLYFCNKTIDQGCLDYHLDKCAGTCKKEFDTKEYIERLNLALSALEGNYEQLLHKLEEQFASYKKQLNFEKARNIYQTICDFDILVTTLKTGFSETKYDPEIVRAMSSKYHKEYADANGLKELQELLKLPRQPVAIDCFDISHFQSHAIVGACVRFTHGIPDRSKFSKFTIRSVIKQNDYAALQEIVHRRYKKQDYPDLIVIDGGKGQLNSVLAILPDNIPCIGLAKKEETVFTCHLDNSIKLDLHTQAAKLLIALRDYTHHFAVRYHQVLRNKQTFDIKKGYEL
jgi:excinuclease ABC subunit C